MKTKPLLVDDRRPVVALVVPALTDGGGVPAVAEFIARTIEDSGLYRLRCVSLATSSTDAVSVRLRDPRSWTGPRTRSGVWAGRPFVHVGCRFCEFEFQRYRPRAMLDYALRDCDLIQVVSGSPAWAGSVYGRGRPVVLACATLAAVERRSLLAGSALGGLRHWRSLMTRVTDRLDREVLRRVDAVAVMNHWMLELARAMRPDGEETVALVPPAVDAKRFRLGEARRVAPEDDPYVLCVGRLNDPRKNTHLLLDAYACMASVLERPPRLVLAGASAPNAAFWQRVAELGLSERVRFVERPDTDALIALYQGAACLALSSDEEGFGMVLLEAMACAVPVVATRCGGPESIVTDGRDGYLVPCKDVHAFAARLLVLLADPDRNRAMGQAARETVLRRFDERVCGHAFLDVYRRLLEPAAVGAVGEAR